ncbi:type I-G CRISPR-associated protein Csb2 [Candidatus Thiosymbion oneisti]|uniref:type I-G CRISPR-associated protein Csb2 n=1 Tax=Candidatus Thiosymbion oneisti TaxID=589554 RepID=UPI000ACA84C7|nr:type I-U CRISPR-associated protein Csb2 [Candidatus Thiosymbion oneisti]
MLTLTLSFPAGRYHATPWGRHVNEADVEWPPTPWRLLRALIAVWHRKLSPVDQDPELFESLLESLAATPPLYFVPPGIHTHSRHYMPARSGKADKNTLIFDAFARVSANDELILAWPDLELDGAQIALIDTLAARLGFLGRAESWVEMQRREAWGDKPNCVPADTATEENVAKAPLPSGMSQKPLSPRGEGLGRGGSKGEDEGDRRLTLMMPMPAADYASFRAAQLEGLKKRSDLKPKDKKAIAATLPESWLDAIGVESAELRAAGWNIPPASRDIPYRVRDEILRSSGRLSPRSVAHKDATTFRFAVYGKPLPRVEDAVRMGEWLRLAAMSQAKKLLGEDAVPPWISGHGLPDGNRHDHAFWLSEDTDRDGKIDHLIVHIPALRKDFVDVPESLKNSVQQAVKGIRRIWNRDGQEWNLWFEGAGEPKDFAGPDRSLICGKSKSFISITPYLMPWHTKRNFGLEEQIRRECQARGLPPIDTIEPLHHVKVGGRSITPLAFHRFRSRRGLTQPDRRGASLRITFTETIEGPLALGFGCHFGLGLFTCEI